MKKNFLFAIMSAIVLTGAVSFSACSSNDDVIDNPNYDPKTNTVKTEFVINVTQPNERTRMTAADAGAGEFQGINNMNLFCFTGKPKSADNEIAAADKLALTSYTGPAIDGTDNTKTNNSSKVYTMYIPTGTTNFLFYATALASVSDKFAKGSLTNNLASATTVATASPATTDIKFNLEPIVSTASDVTTPQGYLTTILNGIKNTSITTPSEKTWASTHGATESQWIALRDAFDQFTNQAHSGDVRQGSSDAILNMVSDLFASVNAVYTNETDETAKALAKAILNNIESYFTVSKTEGDNPTYTWSNPGSYKTGTSGAGFNSNKYPESQNLPTGSAVIVYSSANGFSFVNNGTMGTAAISIAYDNYTYPSQLTYYCNSALWQTTTGKNTTDYPTTSAAWVTEGSWSGWDHSAVGPATRAVAMQDNITYGAAQLFSTIKLGDGVGNNTTKPLVDNASVVTNTAVADNVFDGSTTDKTITLKVHGLLIGGQPDAAQYEYLPQQGNSSSKVIYDRFSADGTAVSTTGVTNYTLALDNYTTGTAQATVNIALEMTADKDFYGASGKIKSGQKFYLIGSLDPANPKSGSTITWANHTSFKSGDTGYNVNRVFIRDAKTEATFTLGANCLKNAYSTIPDLRSTQMLFGISVDLAWKTGLVFDVNIGQ